MYDHIIFDRDGTICEEFENKYITSIEQWKWISNFPNLIKNNKKRFSIVTNQSCIGKGILKEKELNNIHNYIFKGLIDINNIYYCPHISENNCICRKPYPTLILKAIKDSNINKNKTVYIGDSIKDYYAAMAAGIDFILVLTGKGQETLVQLKKENINILFFNNIEQVINYVNNKNNLIQNLKEHIDIFNNINKIEIEKAVNNLILCINNGNKILICGNGGSAADSQHFTAELVGRFKKERRSIPSIALTVDSSILTAISNDYGFEKIFSRQIESLGCKNDILITITTSGNSNNILEAIIQAQKQKINIINLTGNNGGKTSLINKNGINIIIPSINTARIQETHIFILHYFAECIEQNLKG